VASALERLGFTVLEATNGYSGLRMVHHHRPDVVVMEPVLPEMSGQVMVREMRRDPQTRDIPVVLISGNAGSTREEVGHLVDAVIGKPCEPAELKQTMERLSAVPAGA
jgi:twitching motility two-component system response regulator PilH